MRILIDTNIFISREDFGIIPGNLQELLKILNNMGLQVLIHPSSIQEIKKDKNKEREKVILSKISTYPSLEKPPNPEIDKQFVAIVGHVYDIHDAIDNNLLYAIYKNAADFLITQDRDIHRKAVKLGISDRVFDIDEALEYFKKQILIEKIPSPPALQYLPVHNLNINDPIFDSLKSEYPEFKDWWKEICREGRKARVYFKESNKLGAVLIHKIENEVIPSDPPLPRKKRLKICTLQVTHTGYKIGELFIKISIEFAIRNNIDEIYLTHFTKTEDYLVGLIEDFGFYRVAKKNEEDVFVKKLIPNKEVKYPIEIAKEFYPSFYDGEMIDKFIVPIRPKYHNKLFTEYRPRQPTLLEFAGELIIEGNTIKKAYLCHSRIRKISEGDILLFYRSIDERKITSLGVIEKVYHNVKTSDEIARYVGKRSVYNRNEIEEMAKKPIKVILFRWHFHLRNSLTLNYLLRNNILLAAPQSIQRISHEKYLKIKRRGINEHFTVD